MVKLSIIWFLKSENSKNGFDFYFYFLSSLLLALILLNYLLEVDICVNILFDGSNFLLYFLPSNRSVITGVRKGCKRTRQLDPKWRQYSERTYGHIQNYQTDPWNCSSLHLTTQIIPTVESIQCHLLSLSSLLHTRIHLNISE